VFCDKPALDLCDPLDAALRQAEACVEQYAAVGSQRVSPCDKVVRRLKWNPGCVRVERT